MLLTRKQRQDYLLKHYYFKCQCTRCESLENQVEKSSRDDIKIKIYL